MVEYVVSYKLKIEDDYIEIGRYKTYEQAREVFDNYCKKGYLVHLKRVI